MSAGSIKTTQLVICNLIRSFSTKIQLPAVMGNVKSRQRKVPYEHTVSCENLRNGVGNNLRRNGRNRIEERSIVENTLLDVTIDQN